MNAERIARSTRMIAGEQKPRVLVPAKALNAGAAARHLFIDLSQPRRDEFPGAKKANGGKEPPFANLPFV